MIPFPDSLLSKFSLTQKRPTALALPMSLGAVLLFETAALADPVTLDPTTPGSQISGDCSSSCIINSAVPVTGDYLLHSFQDFGVPSGATVTFDSDGIANTLARVTGENPSDIYGRLRLLRGERLFLINPNGIHFHDGAVLDLSGSFMASTAESFIFKEQLILSAMPLVRANEYSAADGTSVFPSSVFSNITGISGLRFNSGPGGISVTGVTVLGGGDPGIGRTLGFLGGPVTLNQTNVQLGNNWHLRLAGVGGADSLPIRLISDGWDFDGNALSTFTDVELQDSAIDLGSGFSSPVFGAVGQSISLTNSQLRTLVATGSGQPIQLQAEKNIVLDASVIQSEALGSYLGNSIDIEAGNDILLSDASVIQAIARQSAIGGDVVLKLNDDLRLDISSVLRTLAVSNAQGGDIEIQADDDILLNASDIQALARDNAVGGNLLIQASNDLRVRGNSVVHTVANQNAEGGDLQLVVGDQLEVNTQSLIQAVGADNSAGGTVGIETRTLMVSNASGVQAVVDGDSPGGGILIDASEAVTVSNLSNILAVANQDAPIGDIKIITDTISLDNAEIGTRSTNTGANITLEASQRIQLDNGSLISAIGDETGSAQGGTITIITPTLEALSNTDNDIRARAVLDLLATPEDFQFNPIDLTGVQSIINFNFEPAIHTSALDNIQDAVNQIDAALPEPLPPAPPTPPAPPSPPATTAPPPSAPTSTTPPPSAPTSTTPPPSAPASTSPPATPDPPSQTSSQTGSDVMSTANVGEESSKDAIATYLDERLASTYNLVSQECTDNAPQRSHFVITGRGGLVPNPRLNLANDDPLQDFRPNSGPVLSPSATDVSPAVQASTKAPSIFPAATLPMRLGLSAGFLTPAGSQEANRWRRNQRGQVQLMAGIPRSAGSLWATQTCSKTRG